MKMQDKAETHRWLDLERHAPWLVLAISLACAYLLWQYAHRASIQEQQVEFDSRVSNIKDCLVRRVIYYEQVLHGVRGFYLNQNKMEPHEFAGYIGALGVEKNFPGIQGISFAPLIPDARKSEHVKSMRESGLAGYSIKPEGKRPGYAPVTMIEPFNERNARVLGFDNLGNAARKMTIERARDEDRAVISEKLVLKQDDGHTAQAGFLMFLPAYRQNSARDTLASRRSNIEGWFAASFRMDDLMASTLDDHSKGLGIEVFDDGVMTEHGQMYGIPVSARQRLFPRYEVVMPVEIGGRKWSIQIFSLPEFEGKRDMTAEHEAVVVGVLLSLLLPLITWQLVRDRRRVVRMTSAAGHEFRMRKQAEYKTRDLHMFNEAIFASSPSGIAVFMASGPCVMANEAYAKLIGGTVEEVLKQDFRHNASWKRNGLLDFANQAFEIGETIRRDIEGVTSFGRKVVVEGIFSPITISEVPHLLLIANDVSGRAAAERALNESMRKLEEKELAKTRFLAAAGHDLRQPVAAANLFVDALKLTEMTSHQDEIIKRLDQAMLTFNGLLDA